jgi:3-hydroxyisobutyrate dehydrogenase-like beta-hydroxyacid dehydrogenase
MPTQRIGILHPGEMGISIAASAKNSGCEVYWTSEGRSAVTRERAAKFELHEAHTLVELCKQCSIVVSVCPPHAAEDLANDVVRAGFRGLYVEANAIAPQRNVKAGETLQKADVTFIDGGFIGMPAEAALYMSVSVRPACE